jgi:hypothetical protein
MAPDEIKSLYILVAACVAGGCVIGFFVVRAMRRDPTLLPRIINATSESGKVIPMPKELEEKMRVLEEMKQLKARTGASKDS